MTLEGAVAIFESLFAEVSDEIGFAAPGRHFGSPDGDGRDWSRAPNGERYVTMTNGGVKAQGEPFPGSSATADEAVQSWFYEAVRLAGARGVGRLFWRERPTIERLGTTKRWIVYSRMAVAP